MAVAVRAFAVVERDPFGGAQRQLGQSVMQWLVVNQLVLVVGVDRLGQGVVVFFGWILCEYCKE